MQAMNHPVFRRFWYPIIELSALAAGPHAFTLLGQELVLWLQADGTPAALADRCPHRQAKLSVDSRVVDGVLACGYHGWRFAGSGACRLIPQMPDQAPGPRSAARAFPCQARYGYAWVCLDDAPLQDIPALRHADDPAFRQIFEYAQDWRANFLRVAENALDIGHVSFVHRQTFGEEEKPAAPRLHITPLPDGVNFRCDLPVANRADQQRNLRIAETETVRRVSITWTWPATFQLEFTYPNGLVHAICGFATPMDDRNSRRIQWCYRSDTEAEAPAANVAAFDRGVGQEDRAILESCPADFPLDPSQEAHMILDRPSLLMRQLLRQLLREHDPNAAAESALADGAMDAA